MSDNQPPKRAARWRGRTALVAIGLVASAGLFAACGGGDNGSASNGTQYWEGDYSNTTDYWSVTIDGNELAGSQQDVGGSYAGSPSYHLTGTENADHTWDVGDDSGNSYLLWFSNGKMYVKNENSSYAAQPFEQISQEKYLQKTGGSSSSSRGRGPAFKTLEDGRPPLRLQLINLIDSGIEPNELIEVLTRIGVLRSKLASSGGC